MFIFVMPGQAQKFIFTRASSLTMLGAQNVIFLVRCYDRVEKQGAARIALLGSMGFASKVPNQEA